MDITKVFVLLTLIDIGSYKYLFTALNNLCSTKERNTKYYIFLTLLTILYPVSIRYEKTSLRDNPMKSPKYPPIETIKDSISWTKNENDNIKNICFLFTCTLPRVSV